MREPHLHGLRDMRYSSANCFADSSTYGGTYGGTYCGPNGIADVCAEYKADGRTERDAYRRADRRPDASANQRTDRRTRCNADTCANGWTDAEA